MDIKPIEIETAASPDYSVIWLHGLGADGHDFESVVPALKISATTPMRFILPHAPLRAITINGGMEMRGWYDITHIDIECNQDRAGIEHSAELLRALIARENQRGIKTKNIFLAGFSQGGAIVLHTALRITQPLAGIIALSTYLPLADSLVDLPADLPTNPIQRAPIFMAHGSYDPLIPIALAGRSLAHLKQFGYLVSWHEYPIEHGVCEAEIADIADFLRAHTI